MVPDVAFGDGMKVTVPSRGSAPTPAAPIMEIIGLRGREVRITGDRERVRLPDGSTVEAEVEPDVDLAAEDVGDSQGNRVDGSYAERVVARVHRQLGTPPGGATGQSGLVSDCG